APLVELRIPVWSFLVAPVVDRAVIPPSTGRGKWPVPCRPRWLACTPGSGSVSPGGAVEVAALVVAMPSTAGSTRSSRSVVSRSTGAAWSMVSRSTGAARSVVSRPARPTGSVVARSTRSTGPSWSARSVVSRPAGSGSARSTGSARPVASAWVAGCRSAVVDCGRRAVVAAGTGWRSGSGAGGTGTRTQRCCPERAGDGSSGHQLVQFHGRSPVYLGTQWTLAPVVPNAR
ncbi:MAG: hypothetical protein QOD02_5108, partial [Mycobacterium sp.]|nr:hypothetical protein [Mycobacterium sp.]